MMMMSNENSQRRTRTKDGHLVIPNLLCHSVAFLLAPVPPAKIAPSDVPAHLESRRWWWWCLQKILRLRAGSRPVSDRHQISAPIARLDHLRYVWCTVLFKAQNCSQPSPAKSTNPTSTCGPYSNFDPHILQIEIFGEKQKSDFLSAAADDRRQKHFFLISCLLP